MFEFLTDIQFVSLFIKFMIASTVLLSAVWLMEKTRLITTPDLAELAWKLAIGGSFLALLPVADIMSSTYVIEDNKTAALIENLNEGRPLRALAAQQTSGTTSADTAVQLGGANSNEPAYADPRLIEERTPPQGLHAAEGASLLRETLGTENRTNVINEITNAADANNAPFLTAEPALTGEPVLNAENDSESAQKTFWYSAADLRTKDLAAIGWIALALLTLGALMISYRDAVKNLGSRKRVEAENNANQLLRAICEKADIRHVPYLSRSGAIKSPVCLPRREICLPDWAFDDMPKSEFKSLLAHELGHMVRRDPIMLMALQILSRTFFFQPMFIIARKRLTDIAELAADEWAAKQAADSRSVANALFTCATKIHETRQIQWGLAMAGNKSILKQRVERLIDAQSVPFKTAGTFAKTALGVGVIGLSLGLPSIEFAGAMSAEGSMGRDLEIIATDFRVAPAPNVAANVGNPTPAPFVSVLNSTTTTIAPLAITHPHPNQEFYGRDNDGGNVSWSKDGERTSLKWEGDFRLNDDETSFIPEDEDSLLRLKTKIDGVRRSIKFEVENGKRVHTYAVNGKEQELDAGGRKWLKASVKRLIKSGFAAEQRVARILKKSKVKGVLKETVRFENDFVKRIYLSELMDQTKLKDKEINQVIDIIAKFDSDFEKRLTLSFMLEEENVSDKVLPKILKVAKGLDSDFEKRLLVTQYVSEMKLTKKTTDLVIDIADTIDSDFELRLLLTSALHDTKLSDKNVQRILDLAIKNIDSDFEKRLLLTSLADEYDRSDAVVAKTLKAAETIDSNFERRLLLSTIISQTTLNEKNWLTAIAIADSIDSDFEKGRVLMHFRSEIPKDNKKIVAALDKAMEGVEQQFGAVIEFDSDTDVEFMTQGFEFKLDEKMAEFQGAMEEFAGEMAELEMEKAELAQEFETEGSEDKKRALRQKSRGIREKQRDLQREMRAAGKKNDLLIRQLSRAKATAAREIERELARVARDLRSADKGMQFELTETLRQLERTRAQLQNDFTFRTRPTRELREPREPREPRELREPREPRGPREPKEPKAAPQVQNESDADLISQTDAIKEIPSIQTVQFGRSLTKHEKSINRIEHGRCKTHGCGITHPVFGGMKKYNYVQILSSFIADNLNNRRIEAPNYKVTVTKLRVKHALSAININTIPGKAHLDPWTSSKAEATLELLDEAGNIVKTVEISTRKTKSDFAKFGTKLGRAKISYLTYVTAVLSDEIGHQIAMYRAANQAPKAGLAV